MLPRTRRSTTSRSGSADLVGDVSLSPIFARFRTRGRRTAAACASSRRMATPPGRPSSKKVSDTFLRGASGGSGEPRRRLGGGPAMQVGLGPAVIGAVGLDGAGALVVVRHA